MTAAPPPLARAAAEVARIARAHPDCADAVLVDVSGGKAVIALAMNVDMPLAMASDGESPNGVRVQEPVEMTIRRDFPWRAPMFRLRSDFPRNLPHIQPDPAGLAPRPCLVDGSQQEFFAQFGLAEAGIFHLLQQLSDWLRKAAVGNLINPEQGWEPVLRTELDHFIVANAGFLRRLVTRDGGWAILKADFYRSGEKSATLAGGARAFVTASDARIVLKADDKSIFTMRPTDAAVLGSTIAAVLWPEKLPSGRPMIADRYLPETVQTLGELKDRAAELGCSRALDGLLANLERAWAGYVLDAPIPIALLLCARRPVHLVGSTSDIELVPYLTELHASSDRESLFAAGDEAPVKPAMHIDTVAPELMRELSGTPERKPISILGCGSLGSKLALHAARSGQAVAALADHRTLLPHNMARHALLPSAVLGDKVRELAKELVGFGNTPAIYADDLVKGLRDASRAKTIIPAAAAAVINTTASTPVREALIEAARHCRETRQFEAALVGGGEGAFLLASGLDANPNACDLMAELYATLEPGSAFHQRMFPAQGGLERIAIGQGCGSMTLRANDVTISAMTAGIMEELWHEQDRHSKNGAIVLGTKQSDSASTLWSRQEVPPFTILPIDGSDGWSLRLTQRVLEAVRAECARWPRVETGGVMIGTASARLKTVTAVDWIDAPPDSRRSASLFVLGTSGLQKAIQRRHAASGRTVYDVGTWHSHLMDEGPSPTDWATARALAAERVPPAVLLIAAPTRFYALQALPETKNGG